MWLSSITEDLDTEACFIARGLGEYTDKSQKASSFRVLPRKMVITPQVSQVLSSCLPEGFSALVPAAAQPVEGAGNTRPAGCRWMFPSEVILTAYHSES